MRSAKLRMIASRMKSVIRCNETERRISVGRLFDDWRGSRFARSTRRDVVIAVVYVVCIGVSGSLLLSLARWSLTRSILDAYGIWW